ncbi:MAG: hypothetical protein K5739_07870 [Lachnospiraceae bacterium]|nr:hypothetical protein [Lachnospiraceae bacterium]
MKKRKIAIIIIVLFLLASGLVIFLTVPKMSPEDRRRQEIIEAFEEKIYESPQAYVPDEETAHGILQAQGRLLRKESPENEVRQMELELENAYGMDAVNLRDMQPETAKDLKKACEYMYSTYPVLQGYLTNIELRDEVTESVAAVALFECDTYITNLSPELYPIVIKKQVLLRAKDFENPRRLENSVTINVRDGYWTEGTDVSAVLVHELGHALVSCILSHKYGLDNAVLIDEQLSDAYAKYNEQQLADHQEFVKEVCNTAFDQYRQQHGEISYEDFCGQISGYAKGEQEDGGISYDETVAEAISHVYVHGKDSADAAKLILEQIKKSIEEYQ